MEKVSEEVLDRMLADYIRTSDSCKGGKGPSYMVQALTELRELRKVMGAVEKALERPGNTVVVYRAVYANKAGWRARLMEDSGAHFKRSSAGDSLRSALAALVKGGESPCP